MVMVIYMTFKKLATTFICVLLALSFCGCKSTDKGYFEGLKWDMSLSAVNNTTKRLLVATNEGNATSTDTTPIQGVECQSFTITNITYIFSADRLTEVVVNAEPAPTYNAVDVLEEIKKEFSEKYTFASEGSNTYRWETEVSTISATVFNSRIIITYSKDIKD